MIKDKKEKEFGLFYITVKAVIVAPDGKVLILKRSTGKEHKVSENKWDLSGGILNKNETLELALKREIKEETGLENIEIESIIYAHDLEKESRKLKALRYLVFSKDKNVKLSQEHQKFEWLEIDKAIEKFSDKGYEKDKKITLQKAKNYLEMKNSLDGWKRCLADFENYRKRKEKEKQENLLYAKENLILQLLPVLDNFNSAVEHVPEKESQAGWVEGIMYIKKQLEDILRENGVEEIELKVGDKFDEKICEAMEDKKNEKNKNKISEKVNEKNLKIKKVLVKGYRMSDKVIRAAKVIVE